MPTKNKAHSVDSKALIEILQNDDLAKFRKLLDAGLDINAPIPEADKQRPIELAMQSREGSKIVAELLDRGVKLKKSDLKLPWAVWTGDEKIIRRFIDKGADVNGDGSSSSPLSLAISQKLHDVVKLLIDAGADVNAKDMLHTPLHEAVQENETESAVLLLKAGAKMESFMLIKAIHQKNEKLAKALVEAGADVNASANILRYDDDTMKRASSYGESTPLIVAVRTGQTGIVRALLTAGADPSKRDDSGATPLDWAKKLAKRDIIKMLEQTPAKKPARTDRDEDLLLAAEKGDLNAVTAALKAGADVSARDKRKKFQAFTPLMLAAMNGHADVVKSLLNAGADVSLSDNLNLGNSAGFGFVFNEVGAEGAREAGFQLAQTALHLAAQKGHADIAKLLIEKKADINQLDRAKTHPLMLAVESGSADLVRALLSAGVDANFKGSNKNAPLHVAASSGHADVARALLDAKPKIELKNDSGNTPLIIAARRFKPQVVSLLLNAGANVNTINRSKETALHAALGTHALKIDIEKGQRVYKVQSPIPDIQQTIRLLVEAGSDLSLPDEMNKTPLDRAKRLAEMTPAYAPVLEILTTPPKK